MKNLFKSASGMSAFGHRFSSMKADVAGKNQKRKINVTPIKQGASKIAGVMTMNSWQGDFYD